MNENERANHKVVQRLSVLFLSQDIEPLDVPIIKPENQEQVLGGATISC